MKIGDVMENVVGMIKFSDFELEFLEKMNIVKEGNSLMNLNNGVPFTLYKVEKDVHRSKYDPETYDRYIFKSNSVLLEFHRVLGQPDYISVYVYSRGRVCYAGEYYDCDMKKQGCKCDIDDAYKSRIIGIHDKNYENGRTYEGHVSVEPKLDGDIVSTTYIMRTVDGSSTIKPHVIESTETKILDDVYHCHSASPEPPLEYIAKTKNFDKVLTEGIEYEFLREPRIVSYYKKFIPMLVETYDRSLKLRKSEQIQERHR